MYIRRSFTYEIILALIASISSSWFALAVEEDLDMFLYCIDNWGVPVTRDCDSAVQALYNAVSDHDFYTPRTWAPRSDSRPGFTCGTAWREAGCTIEMACKEPVVVSFHHLYAAAWMSVKRCVHEQNPAMGGVGHVYNAGDTGVHKWWVHVSASHEVPAPNFAPDSHIPQHHHGELSIDGTLPADSSGFQPLEGAALRDDSPDSDYEAFLHDFLRDGE